MSDPVLVPFRAHHLMSLVDRDTWTVDRWSDALAKEKHPSYSGTVGERILGCAGIMIPWQGTGIAWMSITEQAAKDHGMWMVRTCRRLITDVSRAFRLHRLEAVAIADNEVNQRWLEILGFVRENGVAHHYLPDLRNVVRYERISS